MGLVGPKPDFCNVCGSRKEWTRIGWKRPALLNLPDTLCFQIKRESQDRREIDFPLKNLIVDLNQITVSDDVTAAKTYDLRGVVHQMDKNGGMFCEFASSMCVYTNQSKPTLLAFQDYAHVLRDGRWYECKDETIVEIEPALVISREARQSALILFYRRCRS